MDFPASPVSPAPCVRVVVTAYKRAELLERLLVSLTPPEPSLREVIVVDNADDAATAAVVAQAKLPVRRLVPSVNLSCGGGAAYGMQAALADPATTHCWLFDDDAEAQAGSLAALLRALSEEQAEVAVPLVLNSDGKIAWTPGFRDRQFGRVMDREKLTPTEYFARFGSRPVTFTWCPWPSLLVSRHALVAAGLPRADFWLTGEDIEFSLRLTTQFNGVFVPTASCRHLPPDGGDAARGHAQHYLKFAAMIQNSAFLATRLPHTRTLWKYQPSNWWRFFRTFGYTPGAFVDVLKAVWRGGVRGRTVGMAGFTEFRDRYYQIP